MLSQKQDLLASTWSLTPGIPQATFRGWHSEEVTTKVALCLFSAHRPLVSTSPFKDNPKSARVTAARIIRGWANTSCWVSFSPEKGWLRGDTTAVFNYSKGHCKEVGNRELLQRQGRSRGLKLQQGRARLRQVFFFLEGEGGRVCWWRFLAKCHPGMVLLLSLGQHTSS